MQLRQCLCEIRRLAEQKEIRIEEGHLMPDHVHMMILLLSHVVGYIKGKSAIHLARVMRCMMRMGRSGPFFLRRTGRTLSNRR